MRSNSTGFYENVLQLYVPVEHAPGVDPNECIYELFDDSLSGRNEKRQIRYYVFTLFKEDIEFVGVFSFLKHIYDIIFIISVYTQRAFKTPV